MTTPVIEVEAVEPSVPDERPHVEDLPALCAFRSDFYGCLTDYRDTLFELTDVLPCTDGPVTSVPELTPAAEHRRRHGGMYKAVNHGQNPGEADLANAVRVVRATESTAAEARRTRGPSPATFTELDHPAGGESPPSAEHP